MSDKNEALICVKGLKVHYKGGAIKALDGVDAEIHRGEVVVVDDKLGITMTEIVKSVAK